LNRLAAIVVVLLIGGTAAAFAYTQGLKQTKSPIVATKVTKQFSPVCACPTRAARIGFGLRRSDHVTIAIVDSHGSVVRNLIDNKAVRHGYHWFFWNGHYADGRQAPDGVYKPRVDLTDADRTISLPNLIRIDTKLPRVVGAAPHATKTLLRVRYRFSEQARALLFVNGKRRLKSNPFRTSGAVELLLKDVPKGAVVALAAQDLAGNVSKLRILKLSVRK
jgi:FlgD Ig-like domain